MLEILRSPHIRIDEVIDDTAAALVSTVSRDLDEVSAGPPVSLSTTVGIASWVRSVANLLDNGVEAIVVVGGVLDHPDGAVRLSQRVLSLHHVAITVLGLALHVARVQVLHAVLEPVLGSKHHSTSGHCEWCITSPQHLTTCNKGLKTLEEFGGDDSQAIPPIHTLVFVARPMTSKVGRLFLCLGCTHVVVDGGGGVCQSVAMSDGQSSAVSDGQSGAVSAGQSGAISAGQSGAVSQSESVRSNAAVADGSSVQKPSLAGRHGHQHHNCTAHLPQDYSLYREAPIPTWTRIREDMGSIPVPAILISDFPLFTEISLRATTGRGPCRCFSKPLASWVHCGRAVSPLASHQADTGFNTQPGHRIFACGNRAGRCSWSAGFLGDLQFPAPFHSGTAPYSPQSPSSTLKTSLLRAAIISSLLQLTPSLKFLLYYFSAGLLNKNQRLLKRALGNGEAAVIGCRFIKRSPDVVTCKQITNSILPYLLEICSLGLQSVDKYLMLDFTADCGPAELASFFAIELKSTVLHLLEPASFLHWLLPRCEVKPFLAELNVIGAHDWECSFHLIAHGTVGIFLPVCSWPSLVEESSRFSHNWCGPVIE
ncbi:hypothetical protein PR048_025820 [Dryococelus australis]|uniref:Uncharacterized protein n=1 Tax=Dryococelus australis TaxID=614101 RepID=A0ABQ9GJK8_9NEOP|nr:hypothetical protein PR048_025820 [Dryococelus australis]